MKHTILILLLLSFISQINAQIFTSKILVSSTPDGAEAVEAADLNNDGYTDLVYSSLSDNELAVNIFNHTSGRFDTTKIISSQMNYCTSIFIADLDNDGFKDILATSQYYNDVAWFKNDGNANFTKQALINSNAMFASAVIAFDIDNDGDKDVVSASKDDHKILWYQNDGAGNFSSPIEITNSAEIPVALSFADLNNDNYYDIIAGYAQTDKIVYFLNNGDDSFAPSITLTNQTDYIFSIKTADLNNDGFVDIVSTSKNDNKLAWYKNISGNGFSSQIVICDSISQAYDVEIADFDLDNNPDIIASEGNGKRLFIFANSGGQALFDSIAIVSNYLNNPKGITAGDFDNDGIIDIAVASSNEDKIFYFNNAKANFLKHIINLNHLSTGVITEDIDKDGDQDIFYSDHYGIYAVANEGKNNFSKEITIYEDGYNINTIKFIDIDNDGDKDLFVADGQKDESFWFRNEGFGAFSPKIIIDASGNGPVYPNFKDYDNDGDIDILMLLTGENKIAIYKNTDGLGNFQKVIISDTAYYTGICFTDIDNDNYPDIFFSGSNIAGFLRNNGNGNFQTETILDTNLGYSFDLISADMNNDNSDDILFTPDYHLHYWNNNGDTSYSDTQCALDGIDNFCTGDIDNDNDIDVVSASWSPDMVEIAENINLADSFSYPLPIMIKDANHVYVSDINNDNWNDIIVGSWPTKQLAWLENCLFKIIRNPQDNYVCDNQNANFTVYATGVTSYQWQVKNNDNFINISDDTTYNGCNKANLLISKVSADIIGNQYRCIIINKQNKQLITDTASLNIFIPYLQCTENQTRTTDTSSFYTVNGKEFDIDTIFNKCNDSLTISNNLNNSETLANYQLSVGTHTIIWFLKNSSNQVIDSCIFEVKIQNNLNINEQKQVNFIAFPNPNNGIFTIRNLNTQNNVYVSIFDISGKQIFNTKLTENNTQINISNQPEGIYFLKIKSENSNIIKKIIIK